MPAKKHKINFRNMFGIEDFIVSARFCKIGIKYGVLMRCNDCDCDKYFIYHIADKRGSYVENEVFIYKYNFVILFNMYLET